MAKKKKNKGALGLTDEQAYEAFLADQNKKKQEQANGQVRYREAAQASRVQYTNPTYTGKSKTGNYKWETESLKDYKMPKGMGKSYNDKFDYMTRQMGMSEGQADDFRTYLDFQEDKDKDKYAKKKYNFKKDDKGNIVEDEDGQFKLDRSSYTDGPGLHTKNEIIDGILSGMTQKAVQGVQNAQKRQEDKAKAQEKMVEKSSKERDGFLGFLDSTLGRMGEAAHKVALGDEFVKAQDENYAKNAAEKLKKNPKDKHATQAMQMLNTTARPVDPYSKTEKAADFLGATAGYIAPYTVGGAYGLADGVLGKLGVKFAQNTTKGRVAQDLVRGLTAGTIVGAGREATHKVASDEKINPMNILTEAVSAGAGDAAINGIIRNLNLGRQVKELMDATGSKAYSDEAFQNALKAAYEPKGDVSNVVSDTVKSVAKPNPQDILDELLGQKRNVNANVVPNQPKDFVPEEIPQVEMPNVLDDAVAPEKNIFDELMFAQSSKYAPKARPDLSPVDRPVDPMNRPESYWKDRYEGFADEIKKQGYNPNNLSKESLDELWTQYAKTDEPISLDEAVDLAYGGKAKPDVQPFNPEQILEDLFRKEPNLKDVLKADPEVAAAVSKLDALAPNAKNIRPLSGDYGQAQMDDVDEILSLLSGGKGRSLENAPTPGLPQNIEDLLKNVNNSQVKTPKSSPNDAVKLTLDELNALVRGNKLEDVLNEITPENLKMPDYKLKNPKVETEAVNPAPVSEEVPKQESLLKLNAQRFGNEADEAKSLYSYSKDEPDLVSDHMSLWAKGRESLVNSLQKFQEVSNNIIKRNADKVKSNYEARIEAANKAGRTEEVARLQKEQKYLQKDESELLKSAQNEQTAYMLTDELIQGTYGQAVKALEKAKISVADAWEYQAAKNLHYQMTKGGHADYQLPKGWDKGMLSDIINRGNQVPEFQEFSKAINEIRETRLKYLTDYGLKSTEEFADLAKNPHYIPMMKSFDWTKNSLESALVKKGSVGSARPNVMALGKGDETFFDNPVESLVGATYTSVRNALRNGTHGEFAKLAKLDKDGLFIRPTKEPAVYGGNVIEHYDNGVVQNYVISRDLADVLEELRNPEQAAGVAEKITGFMGSLKTTSIPYQMRAIPRDWTQAIVNMDGNPMSHLWNMISMVKSPKKAMQEAMKEGGAFHNAFKDGMGAHRTTQEMAEQFVNANRAKGGKDEIVRSEAKVKKLFKNIWKLNLDYHVGEQLGNFGDSAPRVAAMRQVEKEFAPAIKELEGKIAGATDDFTKQTLTAELNDLKTQFQREKIFRARDVINYSRRGKSKAAKAFKQYWNFANTATQSVDRYFRQVRKKPVQTILKTAAVSAPMIGAQELWYHNSSDEDKKIYDDSPDFLKNTMYLFVVNGHRIMLPKPFEVALVTSPIEGALNLSHKYDEESASKKIRDGVVQGLREIVPLDIGDLLTMNFSAPSVVQPVMEVKANQKNFNGKPISYYDRYKSSDGKTHFLLEDGVKASDVASKYTSPTAVKLGELVGANPDYIQHLIGGYGGDTGKNALAALDEILKPSSDRAKTVTQNMNPLQDFFNSKKGNWLFRDTYTEKDKDKSK